MNRKLKKAVIFSSLLVSMAACAGSNPLLGQWSLASGGATCNSQLRFEEKMQFHTWRGSESKAPVAGYVVEKDRVYVGGVQGVVTTDVYTFLGPDTIHQPGKFDACVWKRA